METAKYVIFDGMDGSGKGTQLAMLQKRFPGIVFTREPGGTPFAEEIRRIVRDNPLSATSTPLNNFLLFWAAREELMHNLVVPALTLGNHVFSDRGDSSTYAFQLHGEEHLDLQGLFAQLRSVVFAGRHAPDLYVVFDLPADMARERVMKDAERDKNHFDARDLAYYVRVRAGFRLFADYLGESGRVILVNAAQSADKIHEDVCRVLAEHSIS